MKERGSLSTARSINLCGSDWILSFILNTCKGLLCLLNVCVAICVFEVTWSRSTHGTGEIKCGEEGNCKLHLGKNEGTIM